MRNDMLLNDSDAPVEDRRGPGGGWQAWRPWLLVGAAAVGWWLLYPALLPLAEWITFDLLGLSPASQLGMALAFFLYDCLLYTSPSPRD